MKKESPTWETNSITPAIHFHIWLGCKYGRVQIITLGREMASVLFIKAVNGSKLKPNKTQHYHQFNMVVKLMKHQASNEVNVFASNCHH